MEIVFEFDTEYGKFEDALWFPDDEPLPPPEEIEAMKLERLNNWLELVAPAETPTAFDGGEPA
jgi:hypothetical protein